MKLPVQSNFPNSTVNATSPIVSPPFLSLIGRAHAELPADSPSAGIVERYAAWLSEIDSICVQPKASALPSARSRLNAVVSEIGQTRRQVSRSAF